MDIPGLSSGVLNIFVKNVRSLQSEERLEELILEAEQVEWDAVLVNETWREQEAEYDTLESKHIWFGSGGTKGKHGVGILLHRRWSNSVRGWRAVNTRIGVLDLDVGPWKLAIIVVYMPHCGKSDSCLEEVYSTISNLIKEARTAKRRIVIGGDWNAEVIS
jgi:exonuclease III